MTDAVEDHTPAPLSRPSPRDRLRARPKVGNFRIIPIVLDPMLADEYEQAKSKRDQARMMADLRKNDDTVAVTLIEAEDTLAEIERRVRPAVQRHLVVSLGRQQYDDLVNEFPPTKDQRAKAAKAGEERPQFDDTKFPPALIARCLTWFGDGDEQAPPEQDPPQPVPTEPLFTADEIAEDIWNNPQWNTAETMTLFLACVEVNTGRRLVDLGKG